MSTLKELNDAVSINGFERAFYSTGHTIVLSTHNHIRYINEEEDYPRVKTISLGGQVKVITMSPDYSVFVVALEEEQNAKLIVYSCNTYEEQFLVSLRHPAREAAISQGGEFTVCLSVLEERVSLSTFDLKDGVQSCTGDILSEKIAKDWQISFCPADDGVICALGGKTAYLLRCANGYIENFSLINFNDVLCHGWSNDVTMAFGTTDGCIRLYRETIALEIIDIKECKKSLLEYSTSSDILYLSCSLKLFAVLVENGFLIVFPTEQNGPDWNAGKAIIINDWTNCARTFISFDMNDEFVLYTNGSQVLSACLRYTGVICKDEGKCVAAKHRSDVCSIQCSTDWVVSMSGNGVFIVTSRHTGKHLVQFTIDAVIHFSLIEESNEIIVVTNESMDRYKITIDGPQLVHAMIKWKILLCCDSADSSHLAVIEPNRLIVMKIRDQSIVLDEHVSMKREIKRMVFSLDHKYLILLTKNDHVFAVDISSGKTLWSLDYKLQFFTDMTYSNGTVYLLDQKFIVTRIKHGREMTSLNLHAAEVGYTCSSRLITANDQIIATTTDNGAVIITKFDLIDEPFLLKPATDVNVTFIRIGGDNLMIGYEDGSVSLIPLVELEVDEKRDWILCDFNMVQNLNHLIRDLDKERNNIRTETENLVKLYTETRDREMLEMQTEYEAEMKIMKERVKKYEDGFEASEAEKERLMAQLQSLYSEETKLQEKQYEKITSEQIKKTLRLEEQHALELRKKDATIEQTKANMIASFHVTEKNYILETQRLTKEMKSLHEQLDRMRGLISRVESSEEILAIKHKREMEEVLSKRRKDTSILEQEIWNLKATMVQLTEQRDLAANEVHTERNALSMSRQQTTQLKEGMNRTQETVKQLKETLLLHERKDIDQKKSYNKQSQKLIAKEKELQEAQARAHRATRRCQELEARVDRIADCVYDSRRLQHAVLGLLAFMQNIDADERFKLT